MLTKVKNGVVVGASLLALAACGGSGADSAAGTPSTATQAVAEKAATTETAPTVADENVVVVQMWDDGVTFKFEPANFEVKKGQVVRFVHAGTQPHNVEFTRDRAPAGADLGDAWSGPYLITKGEVYEVQVDDRFPVGTYPYVCTPHIAMNMVGEMTVTE